MIVDDHAVVRRGVRAYLEARDDMAVAAEASDGQDALDQLAKMAAHASLPDVVLLDLVMPRMDGVAAASLITSRHPAVRVVILTSFGEMERVHAALAGGAVGYLLKDAGPPRWPRRFSRPPVTAPTSTPRSRAGSPGRSARRAAG